jgi:hypothetical protein
MNPSRLITSHLLTTGRFTLRTHPIRISRIKYTPFLILMTRGKASLTTTRKVGIGHDPYVNNAINSQETVVDREGVSRAVDEVPHDHHELSTSVVGGKSETSEVDIQGEEQRQWQWAVAEEMLPAADDVRSSQILDEVGRMEVWMDSVADRVKSVKTKLDSMEEEGGVVLHLKDS